jgi:hypothetical protein
MKIRDLRRRRVIKHGENVGLALGQAAFAQIIEIKANPVGRPMNWMNKI